MEHKLLVKINGTNNNPWHKMFLTKNPLPQMPRAELMPHMQALAKLDADPIKDTSQIRQILGDLFTNEFIELCCNQFKLGERVGFYVHFSEQ